MTHNQISAVIVDTAIEIHRRLGPGLLESVYQAVLGHELARRGLRVEREVPIPVVWDGVRIEIGFRADLIVEGMVLVELKSVETLAAVHKKQVLTYLRLTDLRLGLLLNFGAALMKDGIHRVVNGLEEPHAEAQRRRESVGKPKRAAADFATFRAGPRLFCGVG
jgi:GxxExxY protein